MALDLKRYAGVWFQVARHNAFYEQGCDNSVAVYKAGDDFLSVANYCYRRGATPTVAGAPAIPGFPDLGPVRKIEGRATPTGEQLVFDIRFEGGESGKYRVLYTDYENIALIGDVASQYFSVLSRKPKLSRPEENLVREILRLRGFKRVEWTARE